MMQIVSCRLPMGLIEELDYIADQEGFPRSQLIRQMLRAYVEYLRIDDQRHGGESGGGDIADEFSGRVGGSQ